MVYFKTAKYSDSFYMFEAIMSEAFVLLRATIKHLCFIVLGISVFSGLFLMSGCSTVPSIEPLATTYPREHTEQVRNIINVPIPLSSSVTAGLTGGNTVNSLNESIEYSPGKQILQTEFTQDRTGDTSEEELWIVPRNSSEFSEESLLTRLEEGGQHSCSGDFRTKSTHYFYGSEATLSFLGISTPAVRARYRCPAQKLDVEDIDFKTISQVASQFRDANYFDILSFNITSNESKISISLQAIVAERRMQIVDQGKKDGAYYIVASRESTLQSNFLPESLVAIVRESSGNSTVTLMHMSYEATYHERGVGGAGTWQVGFVREPQPTSRNVAYNKSRVLGEEIERRAR